MSLRLAQSRVLAFHKAFDLGIGDESEPAIKSGDLRIALIEEEAREFRDAVEAGDLVAAVDALADLLYVTLGSAVEFGVDMGPVFSEVHLSNMEKTGGTLSPTGKLLKPPGWKPPDVAGCLERQRRKP